MAVSDARTQLDPAPATAATEQADPLAGRLGLSVPHEWWPSAPLLKSYEAAGFGWVQLHSPPASVLADRRQLAVHAAAATGALGTTDLTAVVHAPGSLRAGTRDGDRAFQGLLAYAAELGAAQIVYHGLAVIEDQHSRAAVAAETRSLLAHARLAERLEVTIAIENLAPLYPGPETLSATPSTVRALVERIGSPAVAICLDVGHAHVIADRRRTRIDSLCEPALDAVSIFHLHDNFGARRRASGDELGVDPLRLDLHLPPGRGTLPWARLAPPLLAHRAPLLLEVHPPYRPRAAQLAASTAALLQRG